MWARRTFDLEAVALEQPARRLRRVDAVVGQLAVVVEAEQLRDALGVRPTVGQVVNVKRAAGTQHAGDLADASVRIRHVFENAAAVRTAPKRSSSNGRFTGSGLSCAASSGQRSSGAVVGS
jgi:hypothetical protein